MAKKFKQFVCLLLIVSMGSFQTLAHAKVGEIGSVNSMLPTLTIAAQKAARASGGLGANETGAGAINNCKDQFTADQLAAGKKLAIAMTPSDPTKKFHDSINDCLANIQTIALFFNLPTSFSFTAFFEAILNQLIDQIIQTIIMKICAAATAAWNKAVNSAVNTVNTGINQSGVNTFGNWVQVTTTTAGDQWVPPSSLSRGTSSAARPPSSSSIPGL